MLQELRIKDFAIIDDLTVSFGPGLNVFTGETGAGKSIIIDAIDLVLGDRAQAELIRSGREEAVVEARFDISASKSVPLMLEEAGIDPAETLVIKRVVTRSGRNKVYINSSLATLVTLAETGRRLIDVYGQSEHQSLTRPEEHIELLDGFGGFGKIRQEMARVHASWAALKKEFDGLTAKIKAAGEDRELLTYQSGEIGSAGLRPGEVEELKADMERLKNSERLKGVTGAAEDALYSKTGSIIEELGTHIRELKGVASFDEGIGKTVESLNAALYALEDAATFFRDFASGIDGDPARLEEVAERLDAVSALKRKYGETIEDVLAKKVEIDRLLSGIEDYEEELRALEEKVTSAGEKAAAVAAELSLNRTAAAIDLKTKLERELVELGMKGCVFEANLTTETHADGALNFSGKGADHSSFLISTNPGEELKPLARIASGGELSRIMLAMKGLTAAARVPTLIFDEVDTGVSGEMAQVVGSKLMGVSIRHQVICITHLPRVAAFADTHFSVVKVRTKDGRTVTRVKGLDGTERVDDLARMLGGKDVTDTTKKHAEELLAAAGKL